MIDKKRNKSIVITISTLFLLLGTLIITKGITTQHEVESINEKIETVTKKEVFEIWVIDGGLSYVLDDIVEEYREKYPNIKFTIKSFSERIYYKTILAAAATNSLPDMFYTWGDIELKELVKLGIVEDITLTVDSRHIEESMVKGALEGYTIDNKIYGIPVFGWNLVMYCNKELFDEVGIDYQTNYEELVIAIEEFKNHNITPLTISGEDAWTQSMYYMAFALHVSSVEENIKIGEYAKYFSSAQFQEAAKKLESISKLDPWSMNYANIGAVESIDRFIYGRCAMLLNGSWISSIIDTKEYGIPANNVEVINFCTDKKKGVAGFCDGFVLSKKNDGGNGNELMYIEMIRDISDHAVLKNGMGIPIYKSQDLDSTKYMVLKKCQDLFPESRHSAYDRILPQDRVDVYNNALKDLVSGNINSDEFIKKLSQE